MRASRSGPTPLAVPCVSTSALLAEVCRQLGLTVPQLEARVRAGATLHILETPLGVSARLR